MLILLAPSEEKITCADTPIQNFTEIENIFKGCITNLSFHFDEQFKLTEAYCKALQFEPELLFQSKQINQILHSHNNELLPAIQRYCGVAFKAFNFATLPSNLQTIALERIIIFSNLFGALLAKDLIPFYKFKQGAKLHSNLILNSINKIAKAQQSGLIDNYAHYHKCDFIIDLRAKIYENFYSTNLPLVKFKILKNHKSLSHFSKHYRGLIARSCIEFLADSQAQKTEGITKLKHLLVMLESCFKVDCLFDEKQLEITMNFKD